MDKFKYFSNNELIILKNLLVKSFVERISNNDYSLDEMRGYEKLMNEIIDEVFQRVG